MMYQQELYRQELLSAIHNAHRNKSTTLVLEGQYLNALPAEIGLLRNLKLLDLRNVGLTSVPAEIGQLSNLVDLYLSGNSLTALLAKANKSFLNL